MNENELPSTVRDTMKSSGALKLYGLLWFNIADEYWEDEYEINQGSPSEPLYWLFQDMPLNKNYYSKGFIVASLSKKVLSERLNCGMVKLNKAINILIDSGWIKVSNKNSSNQCVYILGKHINGDISLFKDNL